MNISETKKLFRDMCKALGHERGKYGKCSRCKKNLGWIIWEDVGFIIHNATGITKIDIP